jgi:hypothetical protein
MGFRFRVFSTVGLSFSRPSPYCQLGRRRLASIVSRQFLEIKQGGALSIDIRGRQANIDITSNWQDHVDLEADNSSELNISEDAESQCLSVSTKSDKALLTDSGAIAIKVRVPEMFNLFIKGEQLDVVVNNKVREVVCFQTQWRCNFDAYDLLMFF